jgi:hypothetical protein
MNRKEIEEAVQKELGLMLHTARGKENVYKSVVDGEREYVHYFLYPLDGDGDPMSDQVDASVAKVWEALIDARERIAELERERGA